MEPKIKPASLRFELAQAKLLAQRYSYTIAEEDLVVLRPTVQKRGYLLKEELALLAYWKAPRSAGHVKKNSDHLVREITGFALKTSSEQARIQVLTMLSGVSWPTASVILHFFHHDPYPILDFRALWSLSMDVPADYTFEFWRRYVETCRKLAIGWRIDMRTLDRALWQYSKENQSKNRDIAT